MENIDLSEQRVIKKLLEKLPNRAADLTNALFYISSFSVDAPEPRPFYG